MTEALTLVGVFLGAIAGWAGVYVAIERTSPDAGIVRLSVNMVMWGMLFTLIMAAVWGATLAWFA